MQTRRAFVRSGAALSAGAFGLDAVPDVIARALTLDPPAGTTFRDAEHVVILMQENRYKNSPLLRLNGRVLR